MNRQGPGKTWLTGRAQSCTTTDIRQTDAATNEPRSAGVLRSENTTFAAQLAFRMVIILLPTHSRNIEHDDSRYVCESCFVTTTSAFILDYR